MDGVYIISDKKIHKMNYPSVTQVLKTYQNFSMVPKHILNMASERGIQVHTICASIAKGLFISPQEITSDVKGYITSFKKWFEYVDQVILVEEELIDSKIGFIGHPDLVVKMIGDQHLTLVDLKTSSIVGKTWNVQLAAYWHLTTTQKKLNIKRSGSLRLKQNGNFPIFDEYTNTRNIDFAAFLSAFNAWRYFNNNN